MLTEGKITKKICIATNFLKFFDILITKYKSPNTLLQKNVSKRYFLLRFNLYLFHVIQNFICFLILH